MLADLIKHALKPEEDKDTHKKILSYKDVSPQEKNPKGESFEEENPKDYWEDWI